eukprot:scaffold312_cov256-Pinguiococcus_pyrenoidosus.AAC.5
MKARKGILSSLHWPQSFDPAHSGAVGIRQPRTRVPYVVGGGCPTKSARRVMRAPLWAALLAACSGVSWSAQREAQCPVVHHASDDPRWGCGLSTLQGRLSHDLRERGDWRAFTHDEVVGGSRCGFCDSTANGLLSRLVASLEAKKDECENLVVVSTAFGDGYMEEFSRHHPQADLLHEKYGQCFFRFLHIEAAEQLQQTHQLRLFGEYAEHLNVGCRVLAATECIGGGRDTRDKLQKQGTNDSAPDFIDNLHLLVPVNVSALPFGRSRRNGKIFKILAQRIFPWARRILWVDAKLQWSHTLLPGDFYEVMAIVPCAIAAVAAVSVAAVAAVAAACASKLKGL